MSGTGLYASGSSVAVSNLSSSPIQLAPRKISTSYLEPMRGGEHWKEQWNLLVMQSDGSLPETAEKRVELGTKKIDQMHNKIVTCASAYYEMQTDTMSKSEAFSESMIQLGMHQRRTALGSMLCKYGGLLRMLDTFKEQMLQAINEMDIPKLNQAEQMMHNQLKSISVHESETAAINEASRAAGRFESTLGKTLLNAVTKHLEYFEYGYTMFKNLESELRRLREECESIERTPLGPQYRTSTSHRFPIMTTTLQSDRIKRVFGASLNEVVGSEANEGLQIPAIVQKCIDHIAQHGAQLEGIFRHSGAQSEVDRLKQMFETKTASEAILTEQDNVSDVASVLKAYFRELPNPLMTFELYQSFTECSDILEHNSRITKLRAIFKLVPRVNKLILEKLFVLLKTIHDNTAQTKMTSETLAIIFAPVILRPLETHQANMMSDAGRCFEIISYITLNHAIIFLPEPDLVYIQESGRLVSRLEHESTQQAASASSSAANPSKPRSHTVAIMSIPEGRIVPSRFSQASYSFVAAATSASTSASQQPRMRASTTAVLSSSSSYHIDSTAQSFTTSHVPTAAPTLTRTASANYIQSVTTSAASTGSPTKSVVTSGTQPPVSHVTHLHHSASAATVLSSQTQNRPQTLHQSRSGIFSFFSNFGLS